MALTDLNLESGSWLAANCADMPSEKNCKVVMMAPESQRADLISAGVKHAINEHGHEDGQELAAGVESMIKPLEV